MPIPATKAATKVGTTKTFASSSGKSSIQTAAAISTILTTLNIIRINGYLDTVCNKHDFFSSLLKVSNNCEKVCTALHLSSIDIGDRITALLERSIVKRREKKLVVQGWMTGRLCLIFQISLPSSVAN
jgi:hypothetical protein